MAWFAAVPEGEKVKSGKRGEEWSGKALGWTALAVADGGSAGGLGGWDRNYEEAEPRH